MYFNIYVFTYHKLTFISTIYQEHGKFADYIQKQN